MLVFFCNIYIIHPPESSSCPSPSQSSDGAEQSSLPSSDPAAQLCRRSAACSSICTVLGHPCCPIHVALPAEVKEHTLALEAHAGHGIAFTCRLHPSIWGHWRMQDTTGTWHGADLQHPGAAASPTDPG